MPCLASRRLWVATILLACACGGVAEDPVVVAPTAIPASATQGPPPTRIAQTESMLETYLNPNHEEWRQAAVVMERLAAHGLVQGATVADIGAGSGYFADPLSAAVGADGRVLEVDIDPTAVAFLKRRMAEQPPPHDNVEIVHSQPDDVSLPAASVDVALLSEAHFFLAALPDHPQHDPAALPCLESLRRALKPGGAVAVVEIRDLPPQTGGQLDPKAGIVAPFEAAGFVEVAHYDELPRQYFYIFEAAAERGAAQQAPSGQPGD